MTKYRVFLVSQILLIGTSLAVPTNVEETAASTTAAAAAVDSTPVPSSSVLPDGVSESTIATAVEILQRATETAEAISIGNGTILTEDGDGIPDEGWEYENTTYVDTRRILYSKTVEKGKRPYMVYLQLTRESAKAHKYRGWLCGGVIVDKYYVLTSAACVEDADRFYIVSGTTKFVDSFDFKNNDCVCKHRRKVVWKCIPKNYKFDFQDSIKWSSNDIAIVKVDRPFKLGVTEQGCEFASDLICINNVSRELEKPGTKGFIAGWGSGSNFREGVYRRQKVHIPQNAKCLQEAKVCVMDNEQCAKRWAQRFRNIITQYMICTKDVMKRLSELCEKKYANCTDVDSGKARRSAEQFEEPNNEVSTIWNVDLGRHLRDPDDYTARRASNHGGFCENDHGGPLIVKYQNKERVIGVISACKIDPKSHNCHGPFLYTSVFRNRQFISCAINKDVQENCRRVFRTGITHEEWQVSWDGFKEEDEIHMKADSKKDENEFNSDEIAVGKPYLRQNDEAVLDQDAVNIKIEDDSSSEETETNNKKKLGETKEVEKENEEEEEDEETVKKPVKNKMEKISNEEKDDITLKQSVKNKEVKKENEEEEEEEGEPETKLVKSKVVTEEKDEKREETKKKPAKTKGTTEETEEEDDKIDEKPVKINEAKESEDKSEETEKRLTETKEEKEENMGNEEKKEERKPNKQKKERKRKLKKNKNKSKRKVKKEKKNKEVESEAEETEIKTEAKVQSVTEAVMEAIVIEDKTKGTVVKVGGNPDKAEVFYESSRDENVNDPMEEEE